MNFEETERHIKNSPSLRFMRSRKAALMIYFFREQFKEKNEISLRNDFLVQQLANLIDELNYTDEEDSELINLSLDSLGKARRYIERWTEENYLRNYIDDSTKLVYNVLTKHSERVFQMMELLRERDFVGTESRFKDLFYKLNDIVDHSSDNPQKRIEELERQKLSIQEEIDRIKTEGIVKAYEDYQIKSRLDEVFRLTNELVGDFKEVEDNFKEITKKIYERQAQKDYTKGSILGFAFDAIDKLKESDQGKSFYAFWYFLINDEDQFKLRDLIEQVYGVMDERGLRHSDKFLRRIKTLLHMAGRKVLDSNDLLADKLSRVISEKDLNERRKSRETINEIRSLALKLINADVPDDCGITIDGDPDIRMPLERPLGEELVQPEFDSQPKLASLNPDLTNLIKFYNPNLVDKKVLQKNIKMMLQDKQEVSLSEVIQAHPLSKGLGELVAYIALTNAMPKCRVIDQIIEPLLFDTENHKYLETPQIIYFK